MKAFVVKRLNKGFPVRRLVPCLHKVRVGIARFFTFFSLLDIFLPLLAIDFTVLKFVGMGKIPPDIAAVSE